MKRILSLAAAAVLIVGVGSAGAVTIVAPGARWDYQRIANRALVPTPAATLSVVEGLIGSPCVGEVQACTDLKTIWLRRANRIEAQGIFLHELGHNYDAYSLGGAAREAIAGVFGVPVWEPGHSELFADTYEICAEKPHITGRWIQEISVGGLRRVCGILRRYR